MSDNDPDPRLDDIDIPPRRRRKPSFGRSVLGFFGEMFSEVFRVVLIFVACAAVLVFAVALIFELPLKLAFGVTIVVGLGAVFVASFNA